MKTEPTLPLLETDPPTRLICGCCTLWDASLLVFSAVSAVVIHIAVSAYT